MEISFKCEGESAREQTKQEAEVIIHSLKKRMKREENKLKNKIKGQTKWSTNKYTRYNILNSSLVVDTSSK